MTYMLTHIQVADYETWKEMFDSERHGLRKDAKGHRILRGVENPDDLFIQVEFGSPQDAQAAREKLRESGVFDRMKLVEGPNMTEQVDAVTY